MLMGKDNHRWIIIFMWNITDRRRIEQQLMVAKEETERALDTCKTILSNIDVGIVYMDTRYNVLLSSVHKFETLYSKRIYREGTVCYKYVYGRQTPCENCPMRTVFGEQHKAEIETLINGTNLMIAGIPVFDKNGVLIGGIMRLIDVTQQRSFEHQVQESTMRLSMALELGNITPWSWNIELDELIFYTTENDTQGGSDVSKYLEISQQDFRRTIVSEDKIRYDKCIYDIKMNTATEFKITIRSD